MPGTKRPVSALVVIHTRDLQILLIERTAHPGYWQSVTGSQEADEPLAVTACREVAEETGLVAHPQDLRNWHQSNTYAIYPEWRHRYPDGVTHNVEHLFSLAMPASLPVRLAPAEHRAFAWLPWQEAAERVFSWTNRDAILMLALAAGALHT